MSLQEPTPTAAPVKPAKPTFADATRALQANLPGYEARPQQTAMAEAIERLLAAETAEDAMPGAISVNAGCGTGKSFGFAIPAILCGKRTVIATATIALQGQLVDKDLPFLAEHLGTPFTYALLKGRSNYACLAKLAEDPEVANLDAIKKELADGTAVGDREHLDVQVSTEDWRQISATSAECPGASQCPFGAGCFAEKAKGIAADAQIVVTNFAMLGTDMALREATDGEASMLGEFEVLVCDEADGLDNALRNSMTKQLAARGLQQLAGGAQNFVQAHSAEARDKDLAESVALLQAMDALGAALPQVMDPEKPQDAPGGAKLPLIWFADHIDVVKAVIDALDNIALRLRRVDTDGPKETVRKKLLIAQAHNASAALDAAIAADDDDMVRFNTWWKHPKSPDLFWTMEFCPVDISDICRDQLWANQTTVCCSATLTTGRSDFGFFTRTMGFEHAETLDVGTPFDYDTQALLFVPDPTVPDPTERGAWLAHVATATLDLVRASGGGALLLYTSRSAMMATHQVLAPRLRAMGLTVLVQDGQTSNAELARAFREDTDSVLFGLKSFFVGLDVPGDALRLVVIDKLPFPVPTEYVFEARSKAEENAGRNPFSSLSIPMMTLDLTQAFGRLIRSKADRGVVAILDSRLSSRNYGHRIVAGLPDCPAAVDLAHVGKFFAAA